MRNDPASSRLTISDTTRHTSLRYVRFYLSAEARYRFSIETPIIKYAVTIGGLLFLNNLDTAVVDSLRVKTNLFEELLVLAFALFGRFLSV